MNFSENLIEMAAERVVLDRLCPLYMKKLPEGSFLYEIVRIRYAPGYYLQGCFSFYSNVKLAKCYHHHVCYR